MRRSARKNMPDELSVLSTSSNGWRFVIVTDTMFVTKDKSVFVASGDLVILRPSEEVQFTSLSYVGVEVSENYLKKCLELFSPMLYDKWCECEDLIISLTNADEYLALIDQAKCSSDAFYTTFLLKQTIVGCVAEVVRKAKYGQETLPQQVLDALQLLKNPQILSEGFSAFRKATGMSESHLARLFAKYSLEVPSEVYRRARFDYAKELLAKNEDLANVCKFVGYTKSAFKRVYKIYFPQDKI
jgi:AraC-like DNA-binding protein